MLLKGCVSDRVTNVTWCDGNDGNAINIDDVERGWRVIFQQCRKHLNHVGNNSLQPRQEKSDAN